MRGARRSQPNCLLVLLVVCQRAQSTCELGARAGAHGERARWLCMMMVAVARWPGHLEAGVGGSRCEGEAAGRRHCFAALTLAHAQHGAGGACDSEGGDHRAEKIGAAFTVLASDRLSCAAHVFRLHHDMFRMLPYTVNSVRKQRNSLNSRISTRVTAVFHACLVLQTVREHDLPTLPTFLLACSHARSTHPLAKMVEIALASEAGSNYALLANPT